MSHQNEKRIEDNCSVIIKFNMKNSLSMFLDMMRMTAAAVVLLSHFAHVWGLNGFERQFELVNHAAVVVFFVLSGYVITHSTLNSRRNFFDYAVSRLARLYSVVLPSLVLTIALLVVGSHINPEYYQGFRRGSDAIRFVLSLAFIQNVWVFSAAPPTNGPLWSLSYEFFYYLIFGLVYYVKDGLRRWVLVGAAALVAGPPILLLMPCWLLGAAIAVKGAAWSTKIRHPWVLFLGGFCLVCFVALSQPSIPFPQNTKFLYYSSSFVSDWMVAFGFCAMILAFQVVRIPEPSDDMRKRFRAWGDYTFPVYLLHYPLMVFSAAIWPIRAESALYFRLQEGCLIAILLALCYLCERMRPFWRPWLLRMLGYVRIRA